MLNECGFFLRYRRLVRIMGVFRVWWDIEVKVGYVSYMISNVRMLYLIMVYCSDKG